MLKGKIVITKTTTKTTTATTTKAHVTVEEKRIRERGKVNNTTTKTTTATTTTTTTSTTTTTAATKERLVCLSDIQEKCKKKQIPKLSVRQSVSQYNDIATKSTSRLATVAAVLGLGMERECERGREGERERGR